MNTLICAECGAGFEPPTTPQNVMRNGERVRRNVITATPMWCPACIAKRAKPNKSIEAQEWHAKEMRENNRRRRA